MYKPTESPRLITLDNGAEAEPVAYLEDEYGGRAAIIEDDHCYVLCLAGNGLSKAESGGFKPTTHIFAEVLEVMRELPPLTEC